MKTIHVHHGPECLWGILEFLTYHAAGLAGAFILACLATGLLSYMLSQRIG